MENNYFNNEEKVKLAEAIIIELKNIHQLEIGEVSKVLSFAYGLIRKQLKEESENNGNKN